MGDLISDRDATRVDIAGGSVFGAAPTGYLPGNGWAYQPYMASSDIVAARVKDGLTSDARDIARTNPFAKSAVRVVVDSVIGEHLTLTVEPNFELLGVTSDEAEAWAAFVEARWSQDAHSPYCVLDAQRKQTFTGLMRTAYASYYVSGEALATSEWKPGFNETQSCIYLIEPERLSDPRGMTDILGTRRMGVERDRLGEPTAYNIRESHPSDAQRWGPDKYTWKRVERFTPWGRFNAFHAFDHDRPDMTRGISSMTAALQPMRMLLDYVNNELESAALRATYAAVIESELDYEKAMEVIGGGGADMADHVDNIKKNPMLDLTFNMVKANAEYYRGQQFSFGKSKVAHLLPNEKLAMVQGNQSAPALRDFTDVNQYMMAATLGVAHENLTKNYSNTNYSGARASLYDVWRSFEVRRSDMVNSFPKPFFMNWLEEQIVVNGSIPMLGKRSFYEVRNALCIAHFDTWGKPRLDPSKETLADYMAYQMGTNSLRELCAQEGKDWRRVLRQRAVEKKEMDKLKLKPEDIDWELIGQAGQAEKAAGAGGGGGGSQQ